MDTQKKVINQESVFTLFTLGTQSGQAKHNIKGLEDEQGASLCRVPYPIWMLQSVIQVLDLFRSNGIEVAVDGGWASTHYLGNRLGHMGTSTLHSGIGMCRG